MFIRQLSVFIENRKGRLAEFCRLLGEHGIDMVAVTIADTTSFGILRAIVDDTDRAVKLLRDANYAVTVTEVLAVAVEDQPGGLGVALEKLKDAGIGVEYLYSFVRHVGGQSVFLLRVDDPTLAVKVFKDGGIRLLSHDEVLTAK